MTTIRRNMSMADYLAAPGISHSTVCRVRPTPAHCRAYMDEPPPEVEPEHFLLGTLIHQTLLEPDKAWPQIAVKPEGMKFSTTDGKAWRDAQQAAGRPIITAEAYDTLLGCVRSACRHEFIQRVMAKGEAEVSVFDDSSCLTMEVEFVRKIRCDWVPDGNFIMDIKTVRDASPRGFQRAAMDFNWFGKAAWYLDCWNSQGDARNAFLYVAIEKAPPYCVGLYEVSYEALEFGRKQYLADLSVFLDCQRTGDWYGYNPEPVLLGVPAWATKEKVI